MTITDAVLEQRKIGKIRDRTLMLIAALVFGVIATLLGIGGYNTFAAPSGAAALAQVAGSGLSIAVVIFFAQKAIRANKQYLSWTVRDKRRPTRSIHWGWKFLLPFASWYGA